MSIQSQNQRGGLLAALFVRRPVLAFVLNTLIVVAGLAALVGVEVRELPNVGRPVITVTTNFPGASAETVDSEITSTIEGAVARVSGVTGISSSSSFGRSRTTIEFSQNTDLNVAASDTRDAVGRVANQLPDGADTPTIVKADSNASSIMRLSVTSDTLSAGDLTGLVNNIISQRLAAVPGVADVQIYGDQNKIFEVDINQAKLAARGLTLADLNKALSTIAFDAPAGTLNAVNQNIIVRATADVTTPQQIENLQLTPKIRIGDVASVYLAPDPGGTRLRSGGKSGVGIGIVGQAQSNTIKISDGIHAAVAELASTLPKDVKVSVSGDDAVFIKSAIEEVIRSLLISVAVVIAIIFVFLRDWRATLIPAVSIPVALAGALAGLYLAGFSVNILTLLALVLSTGLVVDDAIVVLENIVRQRALGLGRRAATVLGTQEVFFAVVATTATLAAVFVPISFLPGQAGGLFKEFGFTLAIAVLVSSVVALSLTPMMASRLLPSMEAHHPIHHKPSPVERFGGWLSLLYTRSLRAALNAPALVLLAAALAAAIAYFGFFSINQELTPPEDRSQVAIIVQAPQNVSVDYTNSQMRRIEDLMQPLVQKGLIRNIFSISGFGGNTNRGFIIATLAPWDERSTPQSAIAAQINQDIATVPGVRAFAVQPNSLNIRGAGNGLQFALAGNNYADLSAAADKVVAALEADPRFGNIRSSYDTTQAELSVAVDRARAASLGIDITGIGTTLQAMLDGKQIGTVFVNDTSYPVRLTSSTNPVNDPTDLENIFVKTADGRFVPMSSIVTVKEAPVAPSLNRESQRRAISITAGLTPGFALGDAYEQAKAIAEPLLPPGGGIIPLAEAATIGETSNGLLVTFGFAVTVILLVLAAQFESFVSAGIIMVTVPFGLACAVFALLITHGSLNVYSEIGLVLLVGIMAKNGILVVEFANQLRDRGMSVREAIEEASRIRLRPIMMTKLSTILGALPLILAHGAGAEARSALGWVVVGGLGFAAISTLYLTPATYLLFAGLSKPRAHEAEALERELDAATERPAGSI
ncbi:MAG TPA: efflux RND transporter permease subunit [Devosiaceae bacterium]